MSEIRIAATFLTSHGGIVWITESETLFHEKAYDAVWSYNFVMTYRLGEGSAWSYTLQRTLDWVREWDPQITPIENLGDYPVYIGTEREDGNVTVSLEQREGFEKLTANDAPAGAFLAGNALYFFQYWKGRDGVDRNQRILVG